MRYARGILLVFATTFTVAFARMLVAPGMLAQEDTADEAVASLHRLFPRFKAALEERGVPVPQPDLPPWIGGLVIHHWPARNVRLLNMRVSAPESV